MPVGKCRLCLRTGPLQNSHFIPAALYKFGPKPMFATRKTAGSGMRELQTYLLCRECEQRFNRNGESELIRWLAPKANTKGIFPLLDKLKKVTPRHSGPSLIIFSGSDLGIDTDRFAYFVLSIVWRGAVHRWTLPDGSITSPISLGGYEEPIRRFLLGTAPFPTDTVVVVTVCTDQASRGAWFTPTAIPENPLSTYAFLSQGVYFRVLTGRQLPEQMRQICCSSSPHKFIFARSCEDKTMEAYASLSSSRN